MENKRKSIGTKLECSFWESLWVFADIMNALKGEADKIGWKPADLDVRINVQVSSRNQQPQLIMPMSTVPRIP